MEQNNYTDEQLIKMICQGGMDRNKALRYIFAWRHFAKAILMKAGVQASDANDAIQEAIITLDNHVRCGKYQQSASLKNYFIGICRGRVYSNMRSMKRIDWTDDNYKMDGVEVRHPETLMLQAEEKEMIQRMLEKVSEICSRVLSLYRLNHTYEEIAELADLGNANNARQRTFKCRKKLKVIVGGNPLFAHYFKDQI